MLPTHTQQRLVVAPAVLHTPCHKTRLPEKAGCRRGRARQQHATRPAAATQEEEARTGSTAEAKPRAQPPEQGPPLLESERPKEERAMPPEGPVKGQGTAIVTGAISVLVGVLYLAMVQLMNSRGDQLLPPPPEAFGQQRACQGS